MVPLQHCHGPFLSPQPEGPTQTTGDMEGGREGEEVACLSLLLQVTACIPFLLTHCRSLAWSQGAEQMAPAGFASSQQDSFPFNAQISVRKSSLICHYCRFPFQGIPDFFIFALPTFRGPCGMADPLGLSNFFPRGVPPQPGLW